MSTRPAPTRSIARWPFVVGDVFLFALALTALFAGGTPPALGNIVTALICAALGVSLLLAPFLMDYEARLRVAETSARDAGSGQLRRIAQTSEQLANVVARSQATEEQAGQVLGSLEELSEKLAEQSEELSQMLVRVNESPGGVAKTDLDTLATTLHARIDSLDTAVMRLHSLLDGAVGKTVSDLAAIDRTVQNLEERLADTRTPDRGRSAPSPSSGVSGKPETAAAVAAETEPLPTITHDPSAETAKAKTRRRSSRTATVVEEAESPPEELNLELEASNGKVESTSTRSSRHQTTTSLVATAYIGIGNKLFLRGSGAGLSWERGVPMEFLAIGKWGWQTSDASESITCRIYRNDDTPMLDANVELSPGEKTEITPRF